MKIAYLILAHNTPNHLGRLIAALSSSSASFFVHLDQKSSKDNFVAIERADVHLTRKRVSVFWGDFSQVEATLILLRAAFAHEYHFDRFVLLSGADYPLRSAAYIEEFFENNPNKEFINSVAMSSGLAEKPISRLTTYKLRPGDRAVSKIIRKGLMKLRLLSRRRDYQTYLGHLSPYGGSTWWALSHDACAYILNFTNKETRVVNFFKNTICPDESFFQTILGNSRFKSRITRNLTYTDWSGGGARPAHITEKHLSVFASASAFTSDDAYGKGEIIFARKFPDESEDLVARLRKNIINVGCGEPANRID